LPKLAISLRVRARAVEVREKRLALFNVDGTLHAI
jgi:hypothetical protein